MHLHVFSLLGGSHIFRGWLFTGNIFKLDTLIFINCLDFVWRAKICRIILSGVWSCRLLNM
jgi:hypothetical protein